MINYKDFVLKESFNIKIDDIINKLNISKVNIYYILNLDKNEFKKYNLEELYNNNNFNDSLKTYNKSKIYYTSDSETFLLKSVELKYMFLYKNDEKKPDYILMQIYSNNKWSNIISYKINNKDVKLFYDLLSIKTIELIYNNKKYIYKTTNGGNEWFLKKHKMGQETDKFKNYLSKDEMKNLLKDKNIKIDII